MWAESGLQPSSWSALLSLAQLISLRAECAGGDGHVQHVAAAAPQLQQLHYTTFGRLRLQGASSIASLRGLASLHLELQAEDSSQLARSLTALSGLTHLGLALIGERSPDLPQLMQALGQLTGLISPTVMGTLYPEARLASLAALQRLTSLSLMMMRCEPQDSAVLARLGALRALGAVFDKPAAAAAAGLHRLQSVSVLVCMALETAPVPAPITLAAGSHISVRGHD
jgi:hypothetical protein